MKSEIQTSSGKQTLIISDTRDFTVNLSSKLIRQHHGFMDRGRVRENGGRDAMEVERSKFHGTGSPIMTLIVYRRQPNWIS